MPDLFGRIAQEWPVIAAAPVTFVGAVSAAALIIWLALKWSYQSVLDGKNGEIASKASEIALLQRQRDDYRDKLSGASPDEAKAKIDDLERRLLLLEPRRLATEQREAISRVLGTFAGPPSVVQVAYDVACPDCNGYAAEIGGAISRVPGWTIGHPAIMGPGAKSPRGVAVLVSDPQNPGQTANLLIRAFSEAGIEFETLAARGRALGEPSVLVTARVS